MGADTGLGEGGVYTPLWAARALSRKGFMRHIVLRSLKLRSPGTGAGG